MASKIFIDANVILDHALHRSEYLASKSIINAVAQGRFQGFVTPAIVHITNYWLVKAYNKAQAKEILLTYLNVIRVIDCSHETTIIALTSNMDDVEDALQYYAALHHKIDCFITLDQKLHKSATPALPVYYPNEFVRDFIDQ